MLLMRGLGAINPAMYAATNMSLLTNQIQTAILAPPAYGPLICARPGYTWIGTVDGMPGHWQRLAAGGPTTGNPGPADPVTGACGTSEIRVHASGEGGNTSVTATTVISLGPWTIPMPRPGNKYRWLLDDYSKLTPIMAETIGKQLKTPIQSGWKTPYQPGFWKGQPTPTFLTEPGTTASYTYPDGSIETVTWPTRAPWGGEYLTYEGWAKRLGIWGEVIDAGYFGGLGDPVLCGGRSAYACSTIGQASDDQVSPIARFKHPTTGEDWGLWVSIDPVGDPIYSTSHTRAGVAVPPRERRSMGLWFTVQKIPEAPWYSGILKKLFYIPIMLGRGWYDLVCGNPEKASAAASANPYAAAAVEGTKKLCQTAPSALPPPPVVTPVLVAPATPSPPPPNVTLGLTTGQKIAIGLAGLGVGLAFAKRLSR